MLTHRLSGVLILSFLLFVVPLTWSNLVVRGNSSIPARLDTVLIECNATANPPAMITWMKRTTERMHIISNPRVSVTHQLASSSGGPVSRSTLTISNVKAADNGEYICEASNDPSSTFVSASFTLCIIGKKMQVFFVADAKQFFSS